MAEVKAAAGPAAVGAVAVGAVGATLTPDRRGLFLRLTSTRSPIHYPEEVYAKFSAAEKAKHWQLRNPEKERGTGSTGGKKTGINATNISEFASAISSAVLAISPLSDNTKHTADEEETDDDPSNRKNPSLVCQSKKSKSEN